MGAVPFRGSCTSPGMCSLCSPCIEGSCHVATACVASSGLSDPKAHLTTGKNRVPPHQGSKMIADMGGLAAALNTCERNGNR